MTNKQVLEITSGNVICELLVPADNGIMAWLCGFGCLEYGTLSPAYFSKRFNFIRKVLVERLKQADLLDSNFAEKDNNYYELEGVIYQLHLIRVVQKEDWQWPVIINYTSGMVDWINGDARCIATGMTRSDPWAVLPILFWGAPGSDNIFSQDAVRVIDDEQLHVALRAQSSQANLGLTLDKGNLKLIWAHNGTWNPHIPDINDLWVGYMQWFNRYLKNNTPKLIIYTDYPELITDHNSVWDKEIRSKLLSEYHPIFPERLASIEKSIYQQHQAGCIIEHTLIIQSPVPIDVGDLLCWMNLDYSIFHQSDWNFVLCRPDAEYRSTTINVSSIKY